MIAIPRTCIQTNSHSPIQLVSLGTVRLAYRGHDARCLLVDQLNRPADPLTGVGGTAHVDDVRLGRGPVQSGKNGNGKSEDG